MEPEGSLPHPHELATCLYPGSEQSSKGPPYHFLKIHIYVVAHLRLRLSSDLFLKVSQPKPCMNISCLPYV
jgi:hypothetical protein